MGKQCDLTEPYENNVKRSFLLHFEIYECSYFHLPKYMPSFCDCCQHICFIFIGSWEHHQHPLRSQMCNQRRCLGILDDRQG